MCQGNSGVKNNNMGNKNEQEQEYEKETREGRDRVLRNTPAVACDQ